MHSDFKTRLTDCGSYIDFLEFYGRDWFEFLPHHKFYTQASWLAFKQIVANTILEKPLTKGEAEAAFKTNGASLLATAIEQKVVHEQRKKNIKEVYILASDELIVGWLSHIERTRDELRQKLAGNKL